MVMPEPGTIDPIMLAQDLGARVVLASAGPAVAATPPTSSPATAEIAILWITLLLPFLKLAPMRRRAAAAARLSPPSPRVVVGPKPFQRRAGRSSLSRAVSGFGVGAEAWLVGLVVDELLDALLAAFGLVQVVQRLLAHHEVVLR